MRSMLTSLKFFIFLFLSNSSFAQPQKNPETVTHRAFFEASSVVEISLSSDFRRLKTKKEKNVFQPANITLTAPEFGSATELIQIAVRGENRRTVCGFPSLMLDFRSAAPSKLKGLKKMKMVCSCEANSRDEQLLLKEYLAYKIYNLLTPMSFNVRLAKVNYTDVNSKMKPVELYGFLIEDVDDMARRNQCREYKLPVPNSNRVDRYQMTLVSFFQYLIGNTDWSLPNNHNIKFIQLRADSNSFPYAVPYDFDYSGLVDAPYAVPHETWGIEKVTDRIYRGSPSSEEEIEFLVQLFKERKGQIEALVNDFEPLQKYEKNRMMRFVEDFYEILANKRKVKSLFVDGQKY